MHNVHKINNKYKELAIVVVCEYEYLLCSEATYFSSFIRSLLQPNISMLQKGSMIGMFTLQQQNVMIMTLMKEKFHWRRIRSGSECSQKGGIALSFIAFRDLCHPSAPNPMAHEDAPKCVHIHRRWLGSNSNE